MKGMFSGQKLYVEFPNKYTTALRGTKYAAALDQLGAIPRPTWVNDAAGVGVVDPLLDKAAAAGTIGSFVLYAIPNRDLGSHSAGGAADAAAYRALIDKFVAAIGGRTAIVVIEPDALSMIDRMGGSDQAVRYELLRYATERLTNGYNDAGSSNWIDADEISDRLAMVGATGFALNTSGTRPSKDEHAYAQEIRKILGSDTGYGIDTGRNGQGAWAQDRYEPGDPWYYPPTHPDADDMHWLNSPGRGIGARPSLNVNQTLYPGCHWLQWCKSPGGSDGDDHRGHGPAGSFDPYEALALRARAVPRFPAT